MDGGRAPGPDLDPQALGELAAACEAALFAVARPLSLAELAAALGTNAKAAEDAVRELECHLREAGHGVQVALVAGGYQMVTRARYFGVVRRAAGGTRRTKLSAAALETLAIVAYRQPVTRAQIEALRGVNCDAALASLTERGLIEPAYRGDGPGRPLFFRTTRRFLEQFGLPSLESLPPMDGLRLPDRAEQAPAPGRTDGSPREG